MKTSQGIDLYLGFAVKEGLFSSESRLRFHMASLFNGILLGNKTVLDIGGGSGLNSYYAACNGAQRVVCLEPEGDGSSSGVTETFVKMGKHLGLRNVELQPATLQEYQPHSEGFDVILLYNSINHLDENACISLLKKSESKDIYNTIFAKLYQLANDGAKLIVCDCSRYNFFSFVGIRNPFVPTIEWHKHQAPEVWAGLLSEAGFCSPKIQWSSFNRMGSWGKFLLGNKLMAYFSSSHFCLTMDKPSSV